MEPLSYRQMADEIKSVGWEKNDTLEKWRKLKRPAESIALLEMRIGLLRQVWVFLDGLAKGDEGQREAGGKPPAGGPAQPVKTSLSADDDDDF